MHLENICILNVGYIFQLLFNLLYYFITSYIGSHFLRDCHSCDIYDFNYACDALILESSA